MICLCFYLFHEILLFCGWYFSWSALILFLTLFLRFYYFVVDISMKSFDTVFIFSRDSIFCVVDLFLEVLSYCFWPFSWDTIVLWSTFFMKCSDTVFWAFFMRYYYSVVDVFHEVLWYCFWPFSWDTIVRWSTFFMKCSDTVLGIFHEILSFCGRCFLWSALILFLAFFMRYYCSVVDIFLVVLW